MSGGQAWQTHAGKEMALLVVQATQMETQIGFAGPKGASRKGEGFDVSKVTERLSEIASQACPAGWDRCVRGS